jgi:hypothetical protein
MIVAAPASPATERERPIAAARAVRMVLLRCLKGHSSLVVGVPL